MAQWLFRTGAVPLPIALAAISITILGGIPSPAAALDPRCITVKDVVIVGGAEAWADKKLCKSPGSARYDVIEVAQAVYGAAATQAAFEKASAPELRALRGQIENLRAQVAKAGDEANSSRVALLAAQGRFVALLAGKDRGYAEAIAQFRQSVADIVGTPEGAAALAQYNAGDEVSALAILDKLKAANDAARQTQSNIASAAESRRIAGLALDARDRGKVTTAKVIARYEAVVKLDPRVFLDWIELDRLYQDAGRLRDAVQAVTYASETAHSEIDRAKALDDLGDIMILQHHFARAENAYTESLTISRKLAAADPGNALAQRGVVVNIVKIGDARGRQHDLAAADKALAEGLTIARKRATTDPGNSQAQRDVLISLNEIGNLRGAQRDLAGADTAYAEGLAIARTLAAADPGNAAAQRDVSVSLFKLAARPGSGIHWRDVVVQMAARDAAGTLDPPERRFLEQARANAAREGNK